MSIRLLWQPRDPRLNQSTANEMNAANKSPDQKIQMNESLPAIGGNACDTTGALLNSDAASDLVSAADEFMQTRSSVDDMDTPDVSTHVENGASTLIEFPVAGKSTRNRPQWRKDLSERVREIQERRAREMSRQDETELAQTRTTLDSSTDRESIRSTRARRGELPSEKTEQNGAKNSLPLNLVPPTEQPPPNPIVVAALRRVERARQNASLSHHGIAHGRNGAATARAYAPSAQTDAETEHDAQLSVAALDLQADTQAVAQSIVDTARPEEAINQPGTPPETRVKLVAIPTRVADANTVDTTATSNRAAENDDVVVKELGETGETKTFASEALAPSLQERTPRRVTHVVVDEAFLTKIESEQYAVNLRAKHGVPASLSARLIGGTIDLVFAGILTAPFAAVIAWLGDGWTNAELRTSLSLVYTFALFGYLTASVAFVGRTLGMKVFSLRAFDLRTGMLPTAGRSAQRAVLHILSLACLGLGLLFALIDRDRRTVPDRLTQTIVLREGK